jgi:hypothetical protein
MSEATQEGQTPMVRTSSGLRNALFDEIDALRSGDSNPARARSISLLANVVLKSVQVEIEVQKYVNDVSKSELGSKIGVLELGTTELQLGEDSGLHGKKSNAGQAER